MCSSDLVASDGEGAFYQIAVFGKKLDGFLGGHIGEFFFQVEGLVVTAGGVEEFTDVAMIVGEHGFKLSLGWRLLADGDQFVLDSLPVQIFSGSAAGVAIVVCVKL